MVVHCLRTFVTLSHMSYWETKTKSMINPYVYMIFLFGCLSKRIVLSCSYIYFLFVMFVFHMMFTSLNICSGDKNGAYGWCITFSIRLWLCFKIWSKLFKLMELVSVFIMGKCYNSFGFYCDLNLLKWGLHSTWFLWNKILAFFFLHILV